VPYDITHLLRDQIRGVSKVGLQPKDLLEAEQRTQSTNVHTDLAYTVSDTILARTMAKKRALVIKHWIRIAECCLGTRNFECLMAIVESLRTSMIQRLRRTWKSVPKKSRSKFDELKAIVGVDENWRSLRQHMNDACTLCLPFLGIYLTDLTFIVHWLSKIDVAKKVGSLVIWLKNKNARVSRGNA
jgi:hypothetical protein